MTITAKQYKNGGNCIFENCFFCALSFFPAFIIAFMVKINFSGVKVFVQAFQKISIGEGAIKT